MTLIQSIQKYLSCYSDKEHIKIVISKKEYNNLQRQIFADNLDTSTLFDGVEITVEEKESYNAIPNQYEYEIVNKN
jgi:hypothetical protein